MMPKSKLGWGFCLAAVLASTLALGLSGCKSGAAVDSAAAGVVVPCPGTSDPMPAGLPCGLVCRAALPIRASNSQLYFVDIEINDKPALMLVDTGADRTLLSPLAATRIGLPPATPDAERVPAFGGLMQVGSTTMRGMTLGYVRIGPGRLSLLPQTLAVAGTGELGYDGVLGGDILSRYQVELDFRHQMVRLYEGKVCPGNLPGWSVETSVMPFTTTPGSPFVGVTALLDGVPVHTLLDSGAEAIAASDAAARQLNVGPSDLAHDSQTMILGAGPNTVPARNHRFQTLGLGGLTVPQPIVSIVPAESGRPYMIVGDTVLSTRRVWIDYPGRQVHFGRPD